MTAALVPDGQALINEARRRTGLFDFGEDDFRPALDVLCCAMRDEANLTEHAMAWQLEEHVQGLMVRLRMHDWIGRHPGILDQEVTRPIIIVGLQRSGTSKLFRNIASDPQWNVLRTWQALQPVPLSDPPEQPDPRLAMAEQWCAERNWMQHVHSFDAQEPEMEALLMKQGFMINHPGRLVPSHRVWCEEADFGPVYRHLRRQLQFLQWQNGWPAGRRWILKSPPHLLSLDSLAREFPDATLVMTHRHPIHSVGSMLGLVALAQKQSAHAVDFDRVRAEWMRILTLGISRFLAFCDAHGEDRVVHVRFSAVAGDPLAAIGQIYEAAGAVLDDQAQSAALRWHEENPQHKHGKHQYDLSEFGLTNADIEQAFGTYLDRFGHMF